MIDYAIWGEALFATALVGLVPILLLWILPLGTQETINSNTLRVYLAFAAGGLLGDSFLHLLPHSIPHQHGHHHEHHHEHHHHEHHHHEEHGHDHEEHHGHTIGDLGPYLWVLAGLITFLILEKMVRSHTHTHVHAPLTSPVSQPTSPDSSGSDRRSTLRKRKSKKETGAKKPVEKKKMVENKVATIAAAGYLNLAADFSHNFTDGLAIGATFLQGGGWKTTFAMLLHEVPHEIGDYAILLQSGFTRRNAMLSQVATAIGAMLGTVVGLSMEGEENSLWITPFTAGGFIYIACTSVFPELLHESSTFQSCKEILALLSGIVLMIGIALYE